MADLLDMQAVEAAARTAVSVSQLNRRVKRLLEQGIARLWVEGEISNLARPASGHIYFSLKDDSAQIRAAFFRQRQRGPTLKLKDGDKVLAFGRVGIYEARGDYQLIVEQIEPAGEGALKREYDRLRKKLQAEGLFDEDRKKPLPSLPTQIGVITSPSGAAVRDILSVLRRRFPAAQVVIYPAAVQGDTAPGELLAALRTAIRRNECDVLILARGGGSLEDLWAFNDEKLARAVVDSPIATVSAVGHEVDVTITDFVADRRAPTPSGAAEIVVPDRFEWLQKLNVLAKRVARLGRRSLEDKAQSLDWLGRLLYASSPQATFERQAAALESLYRRLAAAMHADSLRRRQRLQGLRGDLLQHAPAVRLERAVGRMRDVRLRLRAAIHNRIAKQNHRLALSARALDSVSPLATLDRGYAIVADAASNTVLSHAEGVRTGQSIRAKLRTGELLAKVTKVIEKRSR